MAVNTSNKPNLRNNEEIVRSRQATYTLWQEIQDDLYAKYPRAFRVASDEILAGKQKDIVIYGYKDNLVCHIDHMLDLVRAFPDQLKAVCVVVEDDTECVLSEYKGLKVVHQQDFIKDIAAYRGSILVDHTIIWKAFNKFANHFSRAGLTYVRYEQFRLAPFMPANNIESDRRDYYIKNLENLLALETLFDDEKSVLVYHTVLQAVIAWNTAYHLAYNDNHPFLYIPEDVDFSFSNKEVFIDAGAFDGSDAIRFARKVNYRFEAIHSFEPEKNNFRLTTNNINDFVHSLPADASRNFYIHPFGLWDHKAIVPILGEAQMVMVQDVIPDACDIVAPRHNNIFVTDLDTYLERATYIKLEVEGAELKSLQGAEDMIRACKPKLAVAAYHLADDFPMLSNFILNLDMNYTLKLRHHSLDWGSLCFYCQVAS